MNAQGDVSLTSLALEDFFDVDVVTAGTTVDLLGLRVQDAAGNPGTSMVVAGGVTPTAPRALRRPAKPLRRG